MNKRPEAELQRACVRWYRMQYAKDAMLLYMNHQNGKNMTEQSILKGLGLVSGVADLTLLHQGKAYFFELKSPNGKQSQRQEEWEMEVTRHGFDYYLINDLDTFMLVVGQIKRLQ